MISTTSGYINGTVKNPTYKQVSAGGTGHAEAVEIVYDPAKVTYAKLLDVFWRNIDPLVKDKQFCDSGDMYRSGVFYLDDEQRKLAEETKKKVAAKFAPRMVYTEITKADTFYPAEDYHQDYYKKNEARYNFYRWNCGRDQRLEQLWGKKESVVMNRRTMFLGAAARSRPTRRCAGPRAMRRPPESSRSRRATRSGAAC